jgi:serine/threonine-protein kinase
MSGESEAAGRWDRVRDLLHQALELDAVRRDAYLDQVCAGDPALRAELESLLSSSSGTTWLDTMVFAGDVAAAVLEEEAGQRIEPGRLIGHYRIVEKLGQGGMGSVFKAVDERLGRTVALKMVTEAVSGTTAKERQRFLREAQSASALSHPNIITIHEFDSDQGRDFIVMEYVEGKTLDEDLSARVPLATLLDYASQIAAALAKAHAAGIVHRDLKPGNVMVTKEGQVKVLDFGLAKQQRTSPISESDETRTTQVLTMAGELIGTPAFMSPEQVLGERLDERSDIFSFGIILYQMACGQRPFRGASQQATLVQIAGQAHRPVRELNPSAPPALADLIDRCLQKKREARLPSMAAALAELNSIRAGLGVEPAVVMRRRAFAASWMIAGGLAVALAAGYFALTRRPAAEPVAATAAALHSIRYSLELRDAATGAASAVPATTMFKGGSKFRLRLLASEAGFLYLVDEGPDENGKNRLFVLSPRPGASAAVPAKQETLTGWVVFDQNPGVEQFWMVWSRQPVALLEDAVRGPGKGLVDTSRAPKIRELLEGLGSKPASSVIQAGNELQVRGSGELLGNRLELRHQ